MTHDERESAGRQGGQLSRRTFLEHAGTAAAGLALGGAAATGCADGMAAVAAPAGLPRRGGVLRLATVWPNVSAGLDPARFDARMEILLGFQLFNTLVRIAPNLQPMPELAESWEAGARGQEWTFRLRRGVTFHNDKPLTADDVIYSLSRHLRSDLQSAALSLLSDVAEFRALDNRTFRIHLTRPNAELPVLLADCHLGILPAGFTDFAHPVGTGPFRYDYFRTGQRAAMRRNDRYWKSGLPYLDAIETIPIPDRLAQYNALLYGNVDLVDEVDPTLITHQDSRGMADVVVSPSGGHGMFVMRCDRPPFDHPDVRRAFRHLIDREAFLREVYKGYGVIANDHPISPLDPHHCSSLPQRVFDPDRARFFLRRAGLDHLTVTLHTSEAAFTNALKGAQVLARGGALAGVTINIQREPTDDYLSRVAGAASFYMTGWYMRPTPDLVFRQAYTTGSPWNEATWSNTRFDQTLAEARQEMDPARRRDFYCQCQRLINEDGGVIIPAFGHNLEGVAQRVKGLVTHPLNGAAGWCYVEQAWLED